MVGVKKSARRKTLLGLMGGKGHGKDHFAGMLQDTKAAFQITHFADKLKGICQEVFGLTDSQVNTLEGKEAPLTHPVVLDMFVPKLSAITGLNIQPHGVVATNVRQILQAVGTDYIRSVEDSYWVDALEDFISRNCKRATRVVVSDVRFPNEVQKVKSLGGMVVKIVRIDLPESGDTHQSETALEGYSPDLILGTVTGKFSLQERVAKLIGMGKWESALAYDYRKVQSMLEVYSKGGVKTTDCLDILGVGHSNIDILEFLLDYYGVPSRGRSLRRTPHTFVGTEEGKVCTTCKGWHPLVSYNKSSYSWDGLSYNCQTCARQTAKESYAKYERGGSLEGVWKLYRNTSRSRSLEFHLTLEDLQSIWDSQQGLCFYTKVPMTLNPGDVTKVSLDRVDSSLGYSKDNVVLCLGWVNLMKRDHTLAEFKEKVEVLFHSREGWGL